MLYINRVRGYHQGFTVPNTPKLNKSPWEKLQEMKRVQEMIEKGQTQKAAEAAAAAKAPQLLAPNIDANDLEDLGFGNLYRTTNSDEE
jgi:hypothetical protein